jgi:hypothetical protein
MPASVDRRGLVRRISESIEHATAAENKLASTRLGAVSACMRERTLASVDFRGLLRRRSASDEWARQKMQRARLTASNNAPQQTCGSV